MRRCSAQDEFFNKCYFVPAMNNAATFGVTTPLGHAIFSDITIQSGAGAFRYYRAALTQWASEKQGQPCASCLPKDTNGANEVSFFCAT